MTAIIDEGIGLLSVLSCPLTLPTANHLLALGFRNIHILNERKAPNIRIRQILNERTGGNVQFSGETDFAELGIPFHLVERINDVETQALTKQLGCAILANCGVSRIIKPPLLTIPRYGVINCHPGELPKYRGRSPIEWSLHNGDPVSASTHLMVEEIDAGPIIETERLPTNGLSYHEIRARMLLHQAHLLAHSIQKVLGAGLLPNQYPTQGEGSAWPFFPDEKIPSLLNRRF